MSQHLSLQVDFLGRPVDGAEPAKLSPLLTEEGRPAPAPAAHGSRVAPAAAAAVEVQRLGSQRGRGERGRQTFAA